MHQYLHSTHTSLGAGCVWLDVRYEGTDSLDFVSCMPKLHERSLQFITQSTIALRSSHACHIDRVVLSWCRRLVQEQQAWVQLLSQYNAMAGSSSAAAGAVGQTAPRSAPLPLSPAQQSPSTAPTPGPAVAGTPAEGSTPAATAAAAGTPLAAAGAVGEGEQEAAAAVAAGLDADAGAGGDAEGPVCAEQQESLLGVQLKVEVLTALVTKMEHLVARAETTARALQVSTRWATIGCTLCCSLRNRGCLCSGCCGQKCIAGFGFCCCLHTGVAAVPVQEQSKIHKLHSICQGQCLVASIQVVTS